MKENTREVSVIIPTYNRAHLIGRAIKSILNQTYQDFEIIVVDDGSTDNTEEVLKGFNDSRILYIRHNHNRGGAAARNTGIKAARGKYIAFQDSDDEWLPEKLEKQMKVFENVSPKVGIVYTDMWRITGDEREYFRSPAIMPDDGIVYKNALNNRVMNIGIQSAVIKRECFDKAGMFDAKFRRLIDLELFIRMSKYYCFCRIDEPLVNYFNTGEGISSDSKAAIEAKELILKKNFEEIKKNKKLLRDYLYNIGASLCLCGKTSVGRNYIIKAIQAYPLNIKPFLAAFVSLFGAKLYRKADKIKKCLFHKDLFVW